MPQKPQAGYPVCGFLLFFKHHVQVAVGVYAGDRALEAVLPELMGIVKARIGAYADAPEGVVLKLRKVIADRKSVV